jgi:nucleotide-binding universal stress UspA family protein
VAVVVWVTEAGWAAAVDAALSHSPSSAEVVLLHVSPTEVEEVARGAFAGLLGRSRRHTDPATAVREVTDRTAAELLEAARQRAGNRMVRIIHLRGRVEREVVAAAAGADLLVVARDGDDRRLGPHSLGPQARFVIDHAPSPVLLVWPGEVPDTATLPSPPEPSGSPPPGSPPETPR